MCVCVFVWEMFPRLSSTSYCPPQRRGFRPRKHHVRLSRCPSSFCGNTETSVYALLSRREVAHRYLPPWHVGHSLESLGADMPVVLSERQRPGAQSRVGEILFSPHSWGFAETEP